jgi:4-hydroxythreonine-4-phosphate dehydrogenase
VDQDCLLVTPGEPAGVGPDLVVQASGLATPFVVVADPAVLADRAARLGLACPIRLVDEARPGAGWRRDRLNVLPVAAAAPVRCGVPDPANAPYVLRTLEVATRACLAGSAAALVTGPVHKETINQAGVPFLGHTEWLAEATGVDRVVMLFVLEAFRVALVTTHLPLAAVPAAIRADDLEKVLRIVDRDLRRWFGCESPAIAVCGLNPHAGEGGYLGREEIDVIAPVLDAARDRGIDAAGPFPADTLFLPSMLSRFDAVLAMYHDQGLPVLKHASFGHGVNVTLGLPIVRTSVDHGTALDLAGTQNADPGSMQAALALADQLSRR